MGGGLMQLVAYGAQDIYLTGNPQITFFKVVYRRHTNFSMESIEQTFSGTPSISGGTVVATISRNGDLVSHLYVEFNPSEVLADGSPVRYVPNVGHELLREMEIEIGGQRIDRQYGHWLNAYNFLHGELKACSTRIDNGDYAIAPVVNATGSGEFNMQTICEPPTMYQKMSFNVKCGESASTTPASIIPYAAVPLQFWFCRNPGLALPLIALQYHEVKVKLTLAPNAELKVGSVSGGGFYSSIKLFADYIYLDTDERRRFAQVSHEYLIEQVQYQSYAAGKKFDLNFNHPVKELIWAGQRNITDGSSIHGGKSTLQDLFQNTTSNRIRILGGSSAVTAQLKLNGHDRFSARHDNYFTRTQVWQHHHGAHTGGGGGGGSDHNGDAVHVYSFALKPEEHQPSGTCNFSRIDNAQLIYSEDVGGNVDSNSVSSGLHVYAVNYNVLRIMSGMGGLAYSN